MLYRKSVATALCAAGMLLLVHGSARAQRIATLAQADAAIDGAVGSAVAESANRPFHFEPGQVDFNLGMLMSQASAPDKAGEGGAGEQEVNNGQDPTRPVRRIDVRYQYQQPDEGLHVNLFTLRMDWPIVLGDGWKLSTRIDLPFAYNNVPSADNPNGDYEAGFGDVLAQAILIRGLNAQWAVLGGVQAIFPTESQDQFGSGSMLLLPTIGARWAPTCLPKGWWLAGLVRYEFDVWKRDGRESVSDLSLQPVFNIALPHRWFATFAPEFKYSFIEDAWFIPFDVTVGTMLTPTTIASVEFKHELYDKYPQYDWAVEFRIGFFF